MQKITLGVDFEDRCCKLCNGDVTATPAKCLDWAWGTRKATKHPGVYIIQPGCLTECHRYSNDLESYHLSKGTQGTEPGIARGTKGIAVAEDDLNFKIHPNLIKCYPRGSDNMK